jgi:hypothetical protein
MMKEEWSDWEARVSAGSERVSIKKGMFDVRGLMFDVKQ